MKFYYVESVSWINIKFKKDLNECLGTGEFNNFFLKIILCHNLELNDNVVLQLTIILWSIIKTFRRKSGTHYHIFIVILYKIIGLVYCFEICICGYINKETFKCYNCRLCENVIDVQNENFRIDKHCCTYSKQLSQ